jgi:hypothetical protein
VSGRDEARGVVERYLRGSDLYWEDAGEDTWYVRMTGEQKRFPGISLLLTIGDYTVKVDSYVIRAPEPEVEARTYRWLLQRNLRQYLHYALDAEGGIHLVGRSPLRGFDDKEMDRLVGSVLAYQDDNFRTLLEKGFPKALAALAAK